MNQTLLTRLFKTIEGNIDTPLMKVAHSIIEDEKIKGHGKFAEQLKTILNGNIERAQKNHNTFKILKESNHQIPVDRRYKLPLATFLEHDLLRRKMVLSQDAENKILRIEKEYLASDRLAHHGLKPRKKNFTLWVIRLWQKHGCRTHCLGFGLAIL